MTQKPIHYTQSLKVLPNADHVSTPKPDRVLGLYRKVGRENYPLEGLWYEKWEDGTEWPIHGTHFIGCWSWRTPIDTFKAFTPVGNNAKIVFSTEDNNKVPAHAHITNVYFTTGAGFSNTLETVVMAVVIDAQQRTILDIVPARALVNGFTKLAIPVNRAYNSETVIGIYCPGGVASSDEDRLNGEVYAVRHEAIAVDTSTNILGEQIVASLKRPCIGVEFLVERPHTDPVFIATPTDRAVTTELFPLKKTLIGVAGTKGLVFRQAFDLTTPNAVDTEQVIIPDSVGLLLSVRGTIQHPTGGNITVDSVFGLIRQLNEKVSIIPPTEKFTNCRYCVVIEWAEGVPS